MNINYFLVRGIFIGTILIKTIYLNAQTSKIDVRDFKQKRTFKEAIYIGINYQLIYSPSDEVSMAFSEINFNANMEKFGISFYAPIGFFFSNFRNTKESLPNYFYDENILAGAKDILGKNNMPYQDTHSPTLKSSITSFSTGIYLNPFYKTKALRYLHLMGGIHYVKGTTWIDYEGDLNPTLNYSYANESSYSIGKEYYDNISLLGGAALVFPFVQVEAGYNFFYETVFINAGLNIPFRVFMKKK